jgi:DNA-binding response OmpR family regulator/predicted regulator of Ras-like GTPase activity (Roadblock/LC7/MglB family)
MGLKMRSILIVDNDQDFLLDLTEGLREGKKDWHIMGVGDGLAAIDILMQCEIDVVITDLAIPGMDGFQLLSFMVKNQPRVPVIVMTSDGAPNTSIDAINLGAFQFLEKSLDFAVLIPKIEKALATLSEGYITAVKKGTPLSDVINIIDMEQRTCTLRIISLGRKGSLHIREGTLLDATTPGNSGLDAALEIMGWENPEIEIVDECCKSTNIIERDINYLFTEKIRLSEENNESETMKNKKNKNTTNTKEESKMVLEDVLKPLQEVGGYLASAIFDMNGEVLSQHNNSKYRVDKIGANAVTLVNAAVKSVMNAGLGKCNFVQVNSDKGIFGAVWAVEDKAIAAVLLEPTGNVGMAKLLLAKVGEEAGSKLA